MRLNELIHAKYLDHGKQYILTIIIATKELFHIPYKL